MSSICKELFLCDLNSNEVKLVTAEDGCVINEWMLVVISGNFLYGLNEVVDNDNCSTVRRCADRHSSSQQMIEWRVTGVQRAVKKNGRRRSRIKRLKNRRRRSGRCGGSVTIATGSYSGLHLIVALVPVLLALIASQTHDRSLQNDRIPVQCLSLLSWGTGLYCGYVNYSSSTVADDDRDQDCDLRGELFAFDQKITQRSVTRSMWETEEIVDWRGKVTRELSTIEFFTNNHNLDTSEDDDYGRWWWMVILGNLGWSQSRRDDHWLNTLLRVW